MNNAYDELKARHQEEVNALPLYWAFGKKQADELFEKLGIDQNSKKDMAKLCNGPAGSIMFKTDAPMVADTFRRHRKELADAIAADPTGEGFIRDMFYSELCNHEYGYTGDASDAIYACGLSYQDIADDPKLALGLRLAKKMAMGD